jgi:hypothetical protein
MALVDFTGRTRSHGSLRRCDVTDDLRQLFGRLLLLAHASKAAITQGMIDYLADFPIGLALLPPRLRSLLEPVGNSPDLRIDVTTRFEFDPYGPALEYVHMIMALDPNSGPESVGNFNETGAGVVYSSQPDISHAGGLKDFNISVSGLDYIVMSRGGGSFYGFQLAEKVLVALGLTPRLLGGEHQKLIYDDLSLPEFGVADGEVSTEYHYTSKRNVNWTMSNEYLRRYLWMRGSYGVRLFFYQSLLPDCQEIRGLMQGKRHAKMTPDKGWYDLDIREHKGGLLIQVWAVVHAIAPELFAEPSAEGLLWPGVEGPMTDARANALTAITPIYLDDRFLEKYEQSSFYETVPMKVDQAWRCSPSYGGQWSFTDCVRVGRNMIWVPMRELYKPKPDREIVHAHKHAIDPEKVNEFDKNEEHVVVKTSRYVEQLLRLAELLCALGQNLGEPEAAKDIVAISRAELHANGWHSYPELSRLAQVAPLDMTEQAFLSRCKSVHELWQQIPNAFLRRLVVHSGHTSDKVKDFASLRLLQAFTNILERLNRDGENVEAFAAGAEDVDLTNRNAALAPLFINNDLRIADAHHAGEALALLEKLGFDVAAVNQGYGRAFDHVFDGIIDSFAHVNRQLETFLMR